MRKNKGKKKRVGLMIQVAVHHGGEVAVAGATGDGHIASTPKRQREMSAFLLFISLFIQLREW